MKKVMFFCTSMQMGGMEKALVNLLNELVNCYDVTLVLECKSGVLLKHLNKKIKISEYRPSKYKNFLMRKADNGLKRLIWSIKNKNKYDFSCNYATYSLLGSRLAQIASKNSSLYVHNNYYDMYNFDEVKIKMFFESHKAVKFQKIIFVSSESKKGISKVLPNLKNKFIVINNLIDNDTILKESEIIPPKFEFQKNKTNFLYVGRLDDVQKNLQLMIQSFSLAIKQKKDLMLYFLGDGPYKEEIVKLIKKNKLTKNIILLGQKENPYYYIKKCDCLLLTSRYEGFPVTYCEALILNQKVLTTIPVSDSYIDVRNYFTIVSEDINEIANEILKIGKEKKNYNIDYKSINDGNLKEIKRLIEG